MMYWSYPEVSAADRLAREGALHASEIRLSPQQAYAQLKTGLPPDRVTLLPFDGRPAYRFRTDFGESIVFADTGEPVSSCPPALTLRIASAWTKQPASAATLQIVTEEDQWTVSEEFRGLRPLRKYSWPDGEEVYVSTVTCEVVQYTTRASRLGAYLGPIPHWLYFTPLRKHGARWARLVIWTSGFASFTALLGLLVGVSMYSPSKRYRPEKLPSSIPYTGRKRWHMLLGLTFGSLACTWAFSGMLSMDPFPRLQSGDPGSLGFQLASALRATPVPLAAFATRSPQQALLSLGPGFHPTQVELASVLGAPVYFVTRATGETRILPLAGPPLAEFDPQAILGALRGAAKPYRITGTRLLTRYDAYYLDRHHALPLPVLFVQLNDPQWSMYYIDPKTARIVEAYNSHSRWNRWLYHGLHSWNFPWLYEYRPAWDIVVITLLLGGIALSVTALLLAWKVLRRSFRLEKPGGTNSRP